MKLRDDKGIHYVPMAYSIAAVSLRKDTWRSSRRQKKSNKYTVNLMFNRDTELYLQYKNKKEAQATYDKIVKVLKQEEEF